jgi:hypothetical protein
MFYYFYLINGHPEIHMFGFSFGDTEHMERIKQSFDVVRIIVAYGV